MLTNNVHTPLSVVAVFGQHVERGPHDTSTEMLAMNLERYCDENARVVE